MLAKIGMVIKNAHHTASEYECPFLINWTIVMTSVKLSEVGRKISTQSTKSASKI